MTERHVVYGNGVPAAPPTYTNQHYVDLTNKTIYLSNGMTTLNDWGVPVATILDLQAVVGNPPETMATLAALSTAMNNDTDLVGNVNTLLASKLDNGFVTTFQQYVTDQVSSSTSAPDSIPKDIVVNDYLLLEEDLGAYLRATANGNTVIRIPFASWVGFPEVHIESVNLGSVRVFPETGVTLAHLLDHHPVIQGRSGVVSIKQVAPNRWTLFGALLLAEGVVLDDIGDYISLMNTVLNFPNDQPTLFTATHALADVPIELFYKVPRGVFNKDGYLIAYPNLNPGVFDVATVAANIKVPVVSNTEGLVVVPGFPVSGTSLTAGGYEVSTSQLWYETDFQTYASWSMSINRTAFVDDTTTTAIIAALPPVVEFSIPHVTRIVNNNWLLNCGWPEAGSAYVGFRPMTDKTYPGFTFIDNLGIAGTLQCNLEIDWDGAVGNPNINTRNYFIGFLTRAAMGKLAVDLVPADIIAGILTIGVTSAFIVNGVVKNSRSDVPQTDSSVEMYFSASPTADLSAATPDQLNAIELYFDNTVSWFGASDPGTGNWSGIYTVDFSGSVFAAVSDVDIRGFGAPGVNQDGWTIAKFVESSFWDSEPAYGAFY